MAAVTVRSQEDGPNGGTLVTLDNFRPWKGNSGRYSAFVVQVPWVDSDGVLICTFADMAKKLPPGKYEGQLVRKCAVPEGAKKELRGTDPWKCV